MVKKKISEKPDKRLFELRWRDPSEVAMCAPSGSKHRSHGDDDPAGVKVARGTMEELRFRIDSLVIRDIDYDLTEVKS